MVDGTTLHLFWANGGTTARFLVCDESAPGTVDHAVATSGSTLHGGEMNTTTHTECWGDNDALGLTAKFSLVTPVTTTRDVNSEVGDITLEDELGANAELEDRVHDLHSGDAAHPWESRRFSMDLSKIDSLAQAADVARFQLDRLGRRRRVVDVGILGNPAVQKNDLVRLEDPLTGIFQNFVVDSMRDDMVEDGQYLGVVSLVRGGVANDEITEPDPPPSDGDSTDEVPGPPFYAGSFSLVGDTITHNGVSQAATAVNIANSTGYHVHLELTIHDTGISFSYSHHLTWESDPDAGVRIFNLEEIDIPAGAGTYTFDFDVTTGIIQATVNPYRIMWGAAQDPHGSSIIGSCVFDIEPL